jgi:osmoprotectant transport system permease protein
VTLEDDLGYFPEYQAVILCRDDLADKAPGSLELLRKLEGRFPAQKMIALNARAKLDRVKESLVAAQILEENLGMRTEARGRNFWSDLGDRTGEHLYLVALSMLFAILLALPLGILAAKIDWLGQPILGLVGVTQTIPSLALLVFMIPLLGIGGPPALVALFLYSLLPIVRNTYLGLKDIPQGLRDSAIALGTGGWTRLRLIELPLASRAILTGIKTATVINIGTATLGALIGAGGYGQPILTGIRLDDTSLILSGAVPAAVMALAAQGVFELSERWLVPKGLRLKPPA